MKKLILLFAFAAISASVSAQKAPTTTKAATEKPAPAPKVEGPAITFKAEEIDYGQVEKGANGVREFVFTNTGSKPLIISDAKGSCGCTVPTFPKEAIMPGNTGKISVKYDTQRIGQFTKFVTLTTNIEGERSTVRLTIKGNVAEQPAPVPTNKSMLAPTN